MSHIDLGTTGKVASPLAPSLPAAAAAADDKVDTDLPCRLCDDDADVAVFDSGPLLPAKLSDSLAIQFVRLGGLNTASLNGKIGTVSGQDASTGRWKVSLHGDETTKLLLGKNLFEYQFDERDHCGSCEATVNLHAFPCCACRAPSSLPRATASSYTNCNSESTPRGVRVLR